MKYYGYEDFEDESNEKTKTVAVKDIRLLYQLSGANLLEYLVNVSTDRNIPGKRVWIFQLNSPVQDEINSFYMNLHRLNNKKTEVIK